MLVCVTLSNFKNYYAQALSRTVDGYVTIV